MRLNSIREKRAKLNILTSVLGQIIAVICGLIVPRTLLKAFGSEAYGATASIGQFIAYITLIEGGIGGVARAALYKPIAENDIETISCIMAQIKKFFRIIAYVFIVYTLVLACSFKTISHIECFNWISSFLLVIVISISTFMQYFLGISNFVLLESAQKTYLLEIITFSATIVNSILVVILVSLGKSLILVQFVSSLVFGLRPVAMWIAVRKNFNFINVSSSNKKDYLEQKWTGLGQHIAFFLHSNTDIVILTIFGNLKLVAVYSVYNLVVTHIQKFSTSFISGLEPLYGNMLANNESENLSKTFSLYESIISIVALVLFSVTTTLIIPFVKLYTDSIYDANYVQPLFSLLLIAAWVVYTLRFPYHLLTVAAGHFRQTKFAAYGEAAINITLSIILVFNFGLIGVAIGTLAATLFRFIFYVIYLSKNIIYRRISLFIKRSAINITCLIVLVLSESFFMKYLFSIDSYITFGINGIILVLFAALITVFAYCVFYRDDVMLILEKLKLKKVRNN